MKSVNAEHIVEMMIPVLRGTKRSILQWSEKKTPLMAPSGGKLHNIHKLSKKVAIVILLTPGRCPQWGRRTPDVLDSTPGRLVLHSLLQVAWTPGIQIHGKQIYSALDAL